MSKYYVACGSFSLVITADSAHHAAMRLIDEVMAAHVWIYDDAGLSEQDRRDHLILEALLHLGTSVAVSQRGIGRCDAGNFEVPKLLEQWHRLMTGLNRLFIAAGLAPRRIVPEAITHSVGPKHPR
jgi:hypothetical protein